MRKQPPFRIVTVRAARSGTRLAAAAWLVVVSVILFMAALLLVQRMQPQDASRLLDRVDSDTWASVMREGMPLLESSSGEGGTGSRSWAVSLLYLLTEVDPARPSTILGGTVPGMAATDYPIAIDGHVVDLRPPDDGSPSPRLFTQEEPKPDTSPSGSPSAPTAPLVYIYHTHNRESFLPMLPGRTNFDDAYDKTKNITLIGARLVEELKKRGVPAIQTTTDYYPMGDYSKEYTFSRKTVQEMLKRYPGLQMIFDIHRDSDPRPLTTAEIGGQSYAKIRFIIGGNNPDHGANEKLAQALKAKLDQAYPHLVRDIWAKRSTTYDATYNQDLSPNMVLVEIGGPENTEEELDRSAACLADGIASLLKERAAGQGLSGSSS
ncbi:MAG: stage II sporulation protein P [Alicyclobacillaceae bacterium]|nr:stage II sporulation protein P [Alicyclobacillaceae bacterium]